MFLALLANGEKHSEILVINLENDCSVGQVLISHESFPTHSLNVVTPIFSSRE